MNLKRQPEPGYIALISVIIISAVLVVLSVSLATSSFSSRFNVLDMESAKESAWLAESCVHAARLRLAEDSISPGNVSVGNSSCSILSINKDFPSTGQTTILVKAVKAQAVTNLQVIINTSDFSLISWQKLLSL